MVRIVLYCIALYCIALYCIALHCIALHICIISHCVVLCCHSAPMRTCVPCSTFHQCPNPWDPPTSSLHCIDIVLHCHSAPMAEGPILEGPSLTQDVHALQHPTSIVLHCIGIVLHCHSAPMTEDMHALHHQLPVARIVLCRVVSCRVVSCRVVSCRVVLCCVVLSPAPMTEDVHALHQCPTPWGPPAASRCTQTPADTRIVNDDRTRAAAIQLPTNSRRRYLTLRGWLTSLATASLLATSAYFVAQVGAGNSRQRCSLGTC